MWTAFPSSRAFHTDHDMLRFLRAREFHLDDAKAMYRKYLKTVRREEEEAPHVSAFVWHLGQHVSQSQSSIRAQHSFKPSTEQSCLCCQVPVCGPSMATCGTGRCLTASQHATKRRRRGFG